jgi:hypothetical protein
MLSVRIEYLICVSLIYKYIYIYIYIYLYTVSLQRIKLYCMSAVIYVILYFFSDTIRAIYNKHEPHINNNKRTKMMMMMISTRRTVILVVKLQIPKFIN